MAKGRFPEISFSVLRPVSGLIYLGARVGVGVGSGVGTGVGSAVGEGVGVVTGVPLQAENNKTNARSKAAIFFN